MRELTKIMIKKYALNKLKYDFMGYTFQNAQDLSFHHLIIARRNCEKYGFGDGYYEWNGALLNQKTSHEYLHIIENYDLDRFNAITSEMIDENIKGYLDLENIYAINDVLKSFEREYASQLTKKGQPLIKEKYLNRIKK